MKRVVKKRAQVWIETVVYTLIAFVIIGAVLSFAKPKIEELQDKSLIEQSIKMLEDIDSTILEIKDVSGNKREIELGLRKGSLTIDSKKDKIVFEIESRYIYTEPEKLIEKGDIKIYTAEKIGKTNKINATIDYTNRYNITWFNEDKIKTLEKTSSSYRIFVSNEEDGGSKIINFGFA